MYDNDISQFKISSNISRHSLSFFCTFQLSNLMELHAVTDIYHSFPTPYFSCTRGSTIESERVNRSTVHIKLETSLISHFFIFYVC